MSQGMTVADMGRIIGAQLSFISALVIVGAMFAYGPSEFDAAAVKRITLTSLSAAACSGLGFALLKKRIGFGVRVASASFGVLFVILSTILLVADALLPRLYLGAASQGNYGEISCHTVTAIPSGMHQ